MCFCVSKAISFVYQWLQSLLFINGCYSLRPVKIINIVGWFYDNYSEHAVDLHVLKIMLLAFCPCQQPARASTSVLFLTIDSSC